MRKLSAGTILRDTTLVHANDRGSEWRQWDLHIHTPASFHWSGEKFDADPDSEKNKRLVDAMIDAMNSAPPAVFALMDYWTFEGWFALKKRLREPNAPQLRKTVLPGIELRLMAPMPGRLNAHVLFSDEISDQCLRDFQSALIVEIINRPLSDDCLRLLARTVNDDKLRHHGLKKAEVDIDDGAALFAGSTIAEINVQSYKEAIEKVPEGLAIGFMPYDTSDGLADVEWREHYAYFLSLFRSSPIFESRNADLRDCFVGEVTEKNKKFIANFQRGLQNIPRLVVSGSDAHCFVGVPGNNDRRGYGDFPSGKATWLKADPTFQGLLQAIMEPAKRSFIGLLPPKIATVQNNKTSFIDQIEISRDASYAGGTWLDGVSINVNSDLVAIIGNKGSGKSALADVVALLGNSKQVEHFSFLRKERFRGKSGDPAKYFTGKLKWKDGSTEVRNLNENPPSDQVELVRYIPQGHFEELCNGHVSGKSDSFEKELRSVIFAHTDDALRMGALDFDQLVVQQEATYRQQLEEYRKDLKRVNQEISGMEDQLQPEVKRSLLEKLIYQEKLVAEHHKVKPLEVLAPKDVLTPEQTAVAERLDKIADLLKSFDERDTRGTSAVAVIVQKQKAVANITERLRIFERAVKQFIDDTSVDFSIAGIGADRVLDVKIDKSSLDQLGEGLSKAKVAAEEAAVAGSAEKEALLQERNILQNALAAPQQAFQQYLRALETWQLRLEELTGTPESPNTLLGIKSHIAQLENLSSKLQDCSAKRIKIAEDIYAVLMDQREARRRLFQPVQDLIQGNHLIREEYKLEFQAVLGGSTDLITSPLFGLIKQNSGDFRGEDESHNTVRRLAEDCEFDNWEGARAFIEGLHSKILNAAHSGKGFGIRTMLRKDRNATEVYDLIFGMSYLEPRYSLLFQQTRIEQLSPGQRGALLLIFYLLVDKGLSPIILDQPEENLDNETVVNLLVPVLTEAKKKRQIIMVTHNPNLAVVCDAEQIIWSVFDRRDAARIRYLTGSIENPLINNHVVNVLEGTMRAFNNRSNKYF